MTDISSPSVPASQNSTGEPATPSGPHVASMSITVVQPRGTTGLVRVGSATRSAELCVIDAGDPCYCGEPGDVPDSTALGVTAAAIIEIDRHPLVLRVGAALGILTIVRDRLGRLTTQLLSLDGGTTTTHSSLSGPGASKLTGCP